MPKLTSDKMLSCSQLPSLFGVSPYSSPNDVLMFCLKSILGEDARTQAGEAADWGNALEPAIIAEMAKRLGIDRYEMPDKAFQHSDLALGASADAIAFIDKPMVINHDPSKGIYVVGGDSIELTAVYWDGMPKFGVGNTDLKTPSTGSWGPIVPLQSIDITQSKGYSVGAQLQHFFSPQWRGLLQGSYAAVEATATKDATAGSLSASLIWSPAKDFDIGLQTMYIRNDYTVAGVKTSDNNYANKIRVERRF